VIEYGIFLHGLAQLWRALTNEIWHKGSLGGEDDARRSNTRIARAYTEKARHTTRQDEKYNWSNKGAVPVDRTCVVVTAFCNPPEAFASDDLAVDQSRYLFTNTCIYCIF